MEHFTRPDLGILPVAGIVDNVISMRAFLGERHLAHDSCQGLFSREFVAKEETFDLLFHVRIDDDDPVHFSVVSGLNKKGGVKNDHGIRLPALKMLYLAGIDVKDLGVEAAVEPCPFLRIVEHDLTELSAVDAAIRKQDILAEVFKHLPACRLFGFEQVMYDPVGIDDMGAEAFEYPRNKTFPACDPACQSNDVGRDVPDVDLAEQWLTERNSHNRKLIEAQSGEIGFVGGGGFYANPTLKGQSAEVKAGFLAEDPAEQVEAQRVRVLVLRRLVHD